MGQPTGGRPSETRKTIVLLGRLMGAGWIVGLSIAGGAGGGFWLDRNFGTSPVLTLIGLAVGIVVAFAGMIQILNAMWDGGSDGPTQKPRDGD